MTELTQEQLAEIRRQQAAWNAEFRVRPSKPNIGIEDFCAMHASVTRMLHHIDHQAARIAELEQRLAAVRASCQGMRNGAKDIHSETVRTLVNDLASNVEEAAGDEA